MYTQRKTEKLPTPEFCFPLFHSQPYFKKLSEPMGEQNPTYRTTDNRKKK
jgi:hypothetical protein